MFSLTEQRPNRAKVFDAVTGREKIQTREDEFGINGKEQPWTLCRATFIELAKSVFF